MNTSPLAPDKLEQLRARAVLARIVPVRGGQCFASDFDTDPQLDEKYLLVSVQTDLGQTRLMRREGKDYASFIRALHPDLVIAMIDEITKLREEVTMYKYWRLKEKTGMAV